MSRSTRSNNLRRRVLKPLVEEVNALGRASTRSATFASIHLSQGTNLLQLSRALGHHSPAFTLTRYTHLLPGDEAPPLDLALEDQQYGRRDKAYAVSPR